MKRALSPTVLVFALGLCCFLLFYGCGGDDDDDSETEEASDEAEDDDSEDELAESLLLTVDDLPTGWAESPPDENETADEQLEECDEEAEGKTGEAETEDFTDNDTREVSQQVAIFESAEAVEAALDRAEGVLACVRDAALDGALDTDEATVTDASLGSVSFEDYGDRTDAYRLTLILEPEDNEVFDEVEVYLDAVYVVVNRVGFAILAADILSPFFTGDLEEIVETATNKVSQALGESLKVSETQDSETEDVEQVDSTPEDTATPTPTSTPADDVVIGDTAETPDGNTITTHSFEAPAAGGEFSEPQAGNVFAAIDVEACAGAEQPEGTWDVNSFDFKLVFRDNTRAEPTFAGIEPEFSFASLRAGDCLRGFISFETPEGVRPDSVLYEGFDADFDDVIIEWLIV